MVNKELIEKLSIYPEDASITICTNGDFSDISHIQYNEFGNEIIIDSFKVYDFDDDEDPFFHVNSY